MDHSYRLVWIDTTQPYLAAPETTCGRNGRSRKGRPTLALVPAVLLLGALLASAARAQVLPQGERPISGEANITRAGNQLIVNQTSPKAVVQWQSFDIGSGARVQFRQPDANAIALNRVVAGGASRIDGQLDANGQVWLVNPNGVVFGPGSQVNVGALVASTLDITDAEFDAGKRTFTRGGATGGITNQGDITVADRGTLALLATTVKNEGVLKARLGNVVLAGGDKILLYAGNEGLLRVVVDPATVRTLIENKKLIMADGGHVLMTSTAADALSASVVSNAGTVQARTLENRKGSIVLHGDIQHSKVMHSGLLDASAPQGGHGGSVETSAARVQIPTGAQVTTAAPQGKTGHWASHSTTDLSLYAGSAPDASGIAADMLTASLTHTHIDLHVYAPGEEKLNIHVNAGIRHDRNRLILDAEHDIDINAPMSVEGSGTLQLNYGATVGSPDTAPAADSNLNVVPGKGRVDFERSGSGLLSINGHDHTVINEMVDLRAMGHADRLGGKYVLGRSLDNQGADFSPIGTDVQNTFHGTFDGLGHTLRNLAIYRKDRPHAGLFGHATNAALRNVDLQQVSVQGGHYTGGLVGHHQAMGGTATISNVRVTGQVSGGSWVGGLAGASSAKNGGAISLSNAHSAGQVRGHSVVGGLVGALKSVGRASIEHASSACAVVGNNAHIGGLVGTSEAGSPEGVANIANVQASGLVFGISNVGGLVGQNTSSGGTAHISAASASGQVSGVKFSGGLVGLNLAAIGGTSLVSDVNATGSVSGDSAVGGLVGGNAQDRHSTASISNARAMGDVSGHAEVGDLVGSNHGMATAMSHATGKVNGKALSDRLEGQQRNTGSSAASGPSILPDFSMPAASAGNRPDGQ